MSVLPILLDDDPRLVAPNAPVERFDSELDLLIRDMLETAWAAPGLGLAAPQVGVNVRLAVVDLSVGTDPDAVIVLVNPVLEARWDLRPVVEGCLSFPDLYTTVRRPRRVRVRALDRTGTWRTHEACEKLAQVFCHELDHLEGLLLPELVDGPRRVLFRLRRALKRRAWRARLRREIPSESQR